MKRLMITAALALFAAATLAQAETKKELVQKVLLLQQPLIENISRSIVERPAAQLMQAAGQALQTQVPADKREAVGKSVQADVKKYVDEATPLLRERAIKLAPSTFGVALEEKFTEAELKQLIAWLESPVNKKFQQLGARDAEQLRAEAGRRSRALARSQAAGAAAEAAHDLRAPPQRARRPSGAAASAAAAKPAASAAKASK